MDIIREEELEEELYNILNGDSDNELLEDYASDDNIDPDYELDSEDEEEQGNDEIMEVDNQQIANPAGRYTWRPVGELNELTQLHYNPMVDFDGVNPDIQETMIDAEPKDFLELFVTEDVINYLVIETNRYANSKLTNTRLSAAARMQKWVNTSAKEIKLFLGMILYMGVLVLPSLAHYWRKASKFTSVLPKYMSRNRFELLLSNFHCANNEEAPANNRLHKIQNLVDMIVGNFQLVVNPGEDMCIDESIIPFRGRLVFRQYIKNKTHPYGIKIFKLCAKDCFTIAYKIYAGREATPNTDVSTKVVLELTEQYLDRGRTLYVDNWYTSVLLADTLLQKRTHLVGTLRKNRKFNPTNVVNKSLRRGEITAQKNNRNIVVLKWKDRRDVLMLSTKHVDNMQTIQKRGREVTKPAAVFEYNKGKSFIDLSDQMGAYSGCLRRGVKWYRKVAFDLMLNTAVVNALSVYKTVTGKVISITEFKEAIINSWLDAAIDNEDLPQEVEPSSFTEHKLVKASRKRCKSCYKKLTKTVGRSQAIIKAKKTFQKCQVCEENMCKDCFFEKHKTNVKK
jgi:hypothetical protein